MPATTSIKSRQVELILSQVESLPTLPVVATRILSLTSSDDSETREVIELIKSDQALTSRVLAICRHADMGIREEVATIDRAVMLLGFNAIRNAVLSIKVFEAFARLDASRPAREKEVEASSLPRVEFWRHSLAVAITAEMIAADHKHLGDVPAAEAFVCGLLHDIGKLAMDHLLPQAFARVVELANLNQGNIAEFERRIIGIDHHTAGKRLAAQWRLPHLIQDCIWLHGSPIATLPKLPHQRMIGLVGLADLIARQGHIGYSGNFSTSQDSREVAEELGLKPERVERAMAKLHERLEERAAALGLDSVPSSELLLKSIQQANQVLGRANAALERRSRTAVREARVLDAIRSFSTATARSPSVQDVLDAVAASGVKVLGAGKAALICPQPTDDDVAQSVWLVCAYSDKGEPGSKHITEPPAFALTLERMDSQQVTAGDLTGLGPWLANAAGDADLASLKLLPITAPGDGRLMALMLHPQTYAGPTREFEPLLATWAAALAAAIRQENLSRLGEALAEANRSLQEMQRELTRAQTLARVGEIASGAAHEMNNPLAIISGRSQLLGSALPPGSNEHKAAATIHEQAHRLSEMISALRLFADPPRAVCQPTDIHTLLDETVRKVRDVPAAAGVKPEERQVSLQFRHELPRVNLDAEKITGAVYELLVNAIQAGATSIAVSVRTTATATTGDEADNALVIQVKDNGCGMDAYTLEHAMDPFFSSKPAGRRMGMGLPRAQQYVSAHNGHIVLRSTPNQGTTATLSIPLDSHVLVADT